MNKKYIKDKKSQLKLVFLLIIIGVSSLFSSQSLIYPYYINIPQIKVYIPLFIFVLIIFIMNKNYYLDIISIMLAIRLVIYLIPFLYSYNVSGYWGNYFAVIASFFAYLISSQNHNKDISRPINKLIVVFLSTISFQVIYLFFVFRAQYGILSVGQFKHYMVIPIGGSNYIASVILPLLIFIYYADIKRSIKFSVLIVSSIALLIIQSKNAIFLLIIFISIKLMNIYLRSLRKIKYGTGVETTILIIVIILTMTIMGIVYYSFKYFLLKWNMGMSYDKSSLYETINALTSNRLNVYIAEIKRWTAHMFFGNGLSYKIGYPRSHNWVIELLVQSGVVGLTVFIIAIVKWYKKVKKQLEGNYLVKSSFYSCLVILLQGLAEVSLFTLSIDILFWFMIGLSISEVNYLKRIKTSQK